MEFFRTLSRPRQQALLAALAVLALAVVAAALYVTLLRSPYKVLFSDLRASEAATILADLDKRNVPYRLEDDGRTILVPAKVADATRVNLSGEDLPLKGAVGFELFNKSDMGLTEFAQQINYRRALQGELARTIMGLEGVESARVHLSLSEPAVFRQDRRPAKASVTVLTRAARPLTPSLVAGVQALVAAAVPDLDAAQVVVLDGAGSVVSRAAPGPLASFAPGLGPVGEPIAQAVRLAARQILHDRPVEVEVVAPPGVVAAPAAEGDALPARDYPIRVRLRLTGELTATERSDLQRMAISAAELDPARGDALLIEAAPPTAAPRLAPAPSPVEAAPQPRTGGIYVSLALGAALIVLLLVAWRLQRARPPRGRLSEGQKSAYAARLQSLLAQERAGVGDV